MLKQEQISIIAVLKNIDQTVANQEEPQDDRNKNYRRQLADFLVDIRTHSKLPAQTETLDLFSAPR